MREFNEAPAKQDKPKPYSGRYQRGSLAQRLFEPLASAKMDEDGTLVFDVAENELNFIAAASREQYECYLNQDELEFDPEEELETISAMFLEGNSVEIDKKAIEQAVMEELGIFKSEDEYSFVKDIREAFDDGLRTSLKDKIFDTLPDHVFYDIKKPLAPDAEHFFN